DALEYPYPDFPGLNLSWEVREAMALHGSRAGLPETAGFSGSGQPLLEAQTADAADSLAYDTHDIDDALSAGLGSFADLDDVPLRRSRLETVRQRHASLGPEQLQPAMIRALIDRQVTDLLEHTLSRLRQERIGSTADVRTFAGPLVTPSPAMLQRKTELEAF